MKSISFNRIKKLQFTASVFLFFAFILRLTLSQYLPWHLADILVMVGLTLHIFTMVLDLQTVSRKKVLTDELSRMNESKATEFTFTVGTVALMITLFIVLFITDTITVRIDLVLCLFVALLCIKNGYYLFLERVGVDNAGTDDEN